MSDYAGRLRSIYLDEVRGDAFFGALSDEQPDKDRREKLETLQTVEARTVTSLRRLLGRAGVKVDEAEARRQGRELARRVNAADWDRLVRELDEVVPHDASKFTELRDAADRPDDPALTALLNHARAIGLFIELESANDTHKSLRPLLDHLRRPA
jgi:hypothetical protein